MSHISQSSASLSEEPVLCSCGKDAKLKTSRTPKNPGRRFYSCKISKSNGRYDYFRWFDSPVSEQTSAVVSGLLRRATEAEVEAEHQSTRVISRLIKSFTVAENETDLLKKKLKESEEENCMLKEKLEQAETEIDSLKKKFKDVVEQRAREEAKFKRLLGLAIMLILWKLLL